MIRIFNNKKTNKMISDISIKNFKSVVDVNLPLGRFNLLIGANGCGKSNILEALTLFSAAHQSKLDTEFLLNRNVRVTEPEYMTNAFEDVEDKGHHIYIGGKGSGEQPFDLDYDIKYQEKSKSNSFLGEKSKNFFWNFLKDTSVCHLSTPLFSPWWRGGQGPPLGGHLPWVIQIILQAEGWITCSSFAVGGGFDCSLAELESRLNTEGLKSSCFLTF
jgi:energy-coupling factor transporter ATP-binding protein EcfA2